MKRVDLVGERFGRLVVVSRVEGFRPTRWCCRCDCGAMHVTIGGNLRSGGVSSCGCLRREQKQAQMRPLGGRNVADLTGQRFGKLTVLGRAPIREHRRSFWRCRCDCGTTTVKMGKYLSGGDTRSCGCDQRAYRSGLHRKYADIAGRFKGEYGVWRAMVSRCCTPSSSNYRHYGGQGVTVCARWRYDFAAFLHDVGPRPRSYSLDRIDPFGNYEPSNCRWADAKTQANNKRRHHAAFLSS